MLDQAGLQHPCYPQMLHDFLALAEYDDGANKEKSPQEWLAWAESKGFKPYWLDYWREGVATHCPEEAPYNMKQAAHSHNAELKPLDDNELTELARIAHDEHISQPLSLWAHYIGLEMARLNSGNRELQWQSEHQASQLLIAAARAGKLIIRQPPLMAPYAVTETTPENVLFSELPVSKADLRAWAEKECPELRSRLFGFELPDTIHADADGESFGRMWLRKAKEKMAEEWAARSVEKEVSQFVIRHIGGASTMTENLYIAEMRLKAERHSQGRFTLDEAAQEIARDGEVAPKDMLVELIKAVTDGKLPVYKPGRNLRYFPKTVRALYEEARASELNQWLENAHPWIGWRFDTGHEKDTERQQSSPAPAKDAGKIPGRVPTVASGRLAVQAAWEIECETDRQASAKEVMERMQQWADKGAHGELVKKLEGYAVEWMTTKRKSKTFDLEACGKALETWQKSRG